MATFKKNYLNKAAQILSRKFKLRIITGAWCLATFILINYYMSILTSFTMAPNLKPLVNSLEDLASKGDVKLVVPKGSAPDVIISVKTALN